ncbi:sigma factor-like helix-turn-helix DNA-binding protein [Kitasatospora sp. NPDC001683]
MEDNPEQHTCAESTALSRTEVAQRLDALPFTVRATAELVYEDGWPLQEVAEVYGVTPGRIQQRLLQARRALGVSNAEEWQAAVGSLGARHDGG